MQDRRISKAGCQIWGAAHLNAITMDYHDLKMFELEQAAAESQKESLAQPEGQGGCGGDQVEQDGCSDRTDVRCPSNASRELEETGSGRSARCFRQRPRADPPAVRR